MSKTYLKNTFILAVYHLTPSPNNGDRWSDICANASLTFLLQRFLQQPPTKLLDSWSQSLVHNYGGWALIHLQLLWSKHGCDMFHSMRWSVTWFLEKALAWDRLRSPIACWPSPSQASGRKLRAHAGILLQSQSACSISSNERATFGALLLTFQNLTEYKKERISPV